MSEEIDHEFTIEITCPNCGAELSDSWEYPNTAEHVCYECKCIFTSEREVEVTYSTSKI